MKKHLLIISLLLTQVAIAQTIRKGPYLNYTGLNTEMQISWQLTNNAITTIFWGTTPDCLDGFAITNEYSIGADGHQHKYIICGLTPNSKYYYKLEIDTIFFSGSFHTAPLIDAVSTNFFIFGDTRNYPEVLDSNSRQMLQEISNDSTLQTFSLVTGDLVGQGLIESDWDNQFFNRTFLNNMELFAKIPLMCVRGNHENYPNAAPAILFNKYFDNPQLNNSDSGDDMYFSFDYGPVHIAVVDQYDDENSDVNPSLSLSQKNWLENDLANSIKPWKFILLHEPAWSASSLTKAEHQNNQDAQLTIQPLCEQYGVSAIFGGHNHYYAHALYEGVHHFTLGGGGAPLYAPSYSGGGVVVYAEETHHFAITRVKQDTTLITVTRPDGSIVERISIIRPVLNPNNFHAEIVSNYQVDLNWIRNVHDDEILLAYDTIGVFGIPTGNYSQGQAIDGGGYVLATGNVSSFFHMGLSPKGYYYKIWSKDTSNRYSNGIETSIDFTTTVKDADIFTNKIPTFSIFPNPSKGIINIDFEDINSLKCIDIANILGERVASVSITKCAHHKIDISSFKKGVYIIIINIADKKYYQKVLIA